MKEMLGIMVFPFISVQVWHEEPAKHAPTILLPRHTALIQACPPYFLTIQSTQAVSTA